MSVFSISLICFPVFLLLYFLYPHLVIILFFLCFSFAVMRFSFSGIELWLHNGVALLMRVYYLFGSNLILIFLDLAVLFIFPYRLAFIYLLYQIIIFLTLSPIASPFLSLLACYLLCM